MSFNKSSHRPVLAINYHTDIYDFTNLWPKNLFIIWPAYSTFPLNAHALYVSPLTTTFKRFVCSSFNLKFVSLVLCNQWNGAIAIRIFLTLFYSIILMLMLCDILILSINQITLSCQNLLSFKFYKEHLFSISPSSGFSLRRVSTIIFRIYRQNSP